MRAPRNALTAINRARVRKMQGFGSRRKAMRDLLAANTSGDNASRTYLITSCSSELDLDSSREKIAHGFANFAKKGRGKQDVRDFRESLSFWKQLEKDCARARNLEEFHWLAEGYARFFACVLGKKRGQYAVGPCPSPSSPSPSRRALGACGRRALRTCA